MATATRVPLISSPKYFRHSHNKCSRLAAPTPFTTSLPESSSLSFRSRYTSSSFSISVRRYRNRCLRRAGGLSISSMADGSKSTVLVTGAGGRTGILSV